MIINLESQEPRIFAILREFERGTSTYQLIEMGYNPELINLLSRIRRYILNAADRRQR